MTFEERLAAAEAKKSELVQQNSDLAQQNSQLRAQVEDLQKKVPTDQQMDRLSALGS